MSIIWDNREIYLLEKLRPKFRGRQIKRVFDQLGYERSFKAIQRQSENLGLTYDEPGIPLGEFTAEEQEIIEEILKEEIETLTSVSIGEEEAPEELAGKSPKEILDMLNELRGQIGKTDAPIIKKEDGEVLVICLSDVHYGARVLNSMSGETIYDTHIAEQCIEALPEKLAQAIPKRQYAGVILALGGDVIDGEEIYPTQGRHLDVSVIDQTRGLVRSLWKVIKTLRKMFPYVCVIGVRGNHGRMSKSADERSNWDNMVYQQLGLMAEMEDDDNLIIEHSYGEYFNFKINGWKGHLRHIAVPHDGTAAMRHKLGSWHQIHNFDFMICGHYHHAGILNYNGKYVFRNGAIMVANDYAERLARQDPARQIVFGVSKSQMPTFISFLDWSLIK